MEWQMAIAAELGRLAQAVDRMAAAVEKLSSGKSPLTAPLTEAQLEQRRNAGRVGAARRHEAQAALERVKTTRSMDLNRATWASFEEAYTRRYKVKPVRNGRVNACISNFVKRVGESSPAVLRFFLAHNDSVYVRAGHTLTLALRDAESLHTQWVRGQQVTGAEARGAERAQATRSQLERVASGDL